MKQKNDAGFSLVEVLVAIVILAAFVVPTCSALVMSARMNAKTDALMQAQLDVSSAVETLMAEGIPSAVSLLATDEQGYRYDAEGKKFPSVIIFVYAQGDPWCKVVVTSKDDLVSVETSVRVVGNGGNG